VGDGTGLGVGQSEVLRGDVVEFAGDAQALFRDPAPRLLLARVLGVLKPSPRARLTERVEELTATRAGVVAAHEAELRRIEQEL
jgi:hypothetical protein